MLNSDEAPSVSGTIPYVQEISKVYQNIVFCNLLPGGPISSRPVLNGETCQTNVPTPQNLRTQTPYW